MVAMTTAVVMAILTFAVRPTAGQAPAAQGQAPAAQIPRTAEGKPDFSGIWQAVNTANWDLETHTAQVARVVQPGLPHAGPVPAPPVLALGAVGGVPGGLGVVEGDVIPYRPEAAAKKKENAEHWLDRDPEIKCFFPGVPRAMYLPYPFQIVHGTNKILMVFEYANANRTIHMDQVEPYPNDAWMGHSVGRWEGDTLVVDVTGQVDRTWFDRAGNFHSDALHVVERYTPLTRDAIRYEATIEDPQVFTRPWKISMPLYRRLEPGARLMEYRCTEFAEEVLYGHLRKQPVVKRWEGETMTIDVTRKIPPLERLYDR
jgi:hypothetical protein